MHDRRRPRHEGDDEPAAPRPNSGPLDPSAPGSRPDASSPDTSPHPSSGHGVAGRVVPPDRDQRRTGARALLGTLASGDADEVLRFSDVFDGLGKRAFGMLLFISTLPAFIPIPGIGGAISGPLTVLIGLQLLIGLRMPWLPGFVGRRGPHRSALQRFERRLSPWLLRLERMAQPRMAAMLDHRLASAVSGLLLIGLGVLLALPIPFTNFVFAILLLLFALALLERDGALMVVAWLTGAVAIVVFGLLSGSLAEWLSEWAARLS